MFLLPCQCRPLQRVAFRLRNRIAFRLGHNHFRRRLSRGGGSGRRRTWGHSLAIAPWGEILVDAGTDPGVTLVDIDLAEVARARARVPSLDHDRAFDGP